MMVFRVWLDIAELLPLLLPALDRLGVVVDTEVRVELLRDPSEAVTTMTVVSVVGTALAVVDELESV